jgi:hypothetical protein
MVDLEAWARRHGVSSQAMAELAGVLSAVPAPPRDVAPQSEAATQTDIRLAVPRYGGTVWRNNVGVLKDETGTPVRYGLANDSQRVNRQVKSSDLIGFFPFTVGAQHVGRRLAIFTAIECKAAGWTWRGDAREEAQRRFLQLVEAGGGIGTFARGTDDLLHYLAQWERP